MQVSALSADAINAEQTAIIDKSNFFALILNSNLVIVYCKFNLQSNKTARKIVRNLYANSNNHDFIGVFRALFFDR